MFALVFLFCSGVFFGRGGGGERCELFWLFLFLFWLVGGFLECCYSQSEIEGQVDQSFQVSLLQPFPVNDTRHVCAGDCTLQILAHTGTGLEEHHPEVYT